MAAHDDPRSETNPLFNDNRLKLGTFGTNVSSGCAITTAPEAFVMNWPNTLRLAQTAERLGFEAIVPVARWKGFGGQSNFNGTAFETYTWAAGLAQATKETCVLTTSHVPTVHPIMAAKQAVTVDHISGGRFALNIVCGWFAPELEMFGAKIMEHDQRYDYAAEWIEIIKRLWTEDDEFDYEGKFLKVAKGYAMPKPVQRPFPPLMNAGSSGKGQHFAAKYADMAFLAIDPTDLDKSRRLIESYRRLAREEYGRDIQVWTAASITQGDTQKEADDLWNYYTVEKGDDDAIDNLLRIQMVQAQRLLNEDLETRRKQMRGGWGGYRIIGTPEVVVERLKGLSEIGIDGVLLSWLDYDDGFVRFERQILPMLEQAGLRRPLQPGAKSAA
jgi:alkanesulfonate monooxygenase SsuD/methylene tetrahydromethanopterin reductase-like flavin-dependent oxidoreductase (luciferase family)